jgi:hypothetical protein
MSNELDRLDEDVSDLKQQVANLRQAGRPRGVRKRSTRQLLGMPLYDIALGPDPDRNEVRGHARGILAVGDIATGVVALGGVAKGFFALGGVALGVVSLGGCSLGILLGCGGCAVGGVAIGGLAIGALALGGAAIGLVAIGGGAAGYYACGGGAWGKYVVSAAQQDPQAVSFFKDMAGLLGIRWR